MVFIVNLVLFCSLVVFVIVYIIFVLVGYEILMGKYLSIVLFIVLISMLMFSIFCIFVGWKEYVCDELECLV